MDVDEILGCRKWRGLRRGDCDNHGTWKLHIRVCRLETLNARRKRGSFTHLGYTGNLKSGRSHVLVSVSGDEQEDLDLPW